MKPLRLNKTRAAQKRAREFRSNMGVSEKVFWQVVRRDQLGARVRRQVAIGPYFLDFYIPAAKLCVEIDGEQHGARADADVFRDGYLAEYGIRTSRIPSLDLFCETAPRFTEWIGFLRKLCAERRDSPPPTPSSTPSSRKRKEGDAPDR